MAKNTAPKGGTKKQQRINPGTAERDTIPKILSPSNVAAIARAEAKQVMGKQVTGFTEFLREQNVISIGIGLVLGIQIKAVVDTVMASLVNPITQLLLPGQEELSKKSFVLSLDGKQVDIGWGAVVYSLFTFVLVAVIIYGGYKLLRLDKLAKKKDD